jgi:hypothetical protein
MKKTARTVEEAILLLPKPEQAIVKRLRALIQECLPAAIEKGYYGEGVPFYTHHRMICFIWPSSIYWGPKPKEKVGKNKLVTLGFCQGNRMSNEDGLLKAEGRKQVYCMYFNSLAEIEEEKIRALLFEAELIDKDFGAKKKAKKRKQ